MTITIPLSQGKVAIVDDCDADLLEFKWCMVGNYAGRRQYGGEKPIGLYLHRVILSRKIGRELQEGEQVDHINREKLDNTRGNLRLASRKQNAMNKPARSNAQQLPKGVVRVGKSRYKSVVNKVYSEAYTSAYFAALSYDKVAREMYGEFAYLNHPEITDYTDLSEHIVPPHEWVDALEAYSAANNVSSQSIIEHYINQKGTASAIARLLNVSRQMACLMLNKRGYFYTGTPAHGYWSRIEKATE